jgi:hypothetical protein
MNFAISWIFNLFRKPQAEVTFKPEATAWPFPTPKEKKPAAKKPTAKKVVVKKATKVVKKAKK